MTYPSNSWLPLDLLRQVRGLLRLRYGGSGNKHGWGRGAIFAGWNATGGDLALGTVVKYTGGGNMVEPCTAATDRALGVVVGYLDGADVLVEADAPDVGSVAVLTAGVTDVLIATDVGRGDDATPSTTAGQASNSGSAFGQFIGPGTAGLTAQVLILASGGGSAAPLDATYLVTTSDPDLTNEVVVGATPGGELGGTWSSPTVDTTHSGSSHAGATAAAETYSDAADAAHVAAADPHTGYLKESDFQAVDFLVGTATGLTAAEIVAGTTPGGELGGTWAAPTVDTTHSGSSHADAIAAATAASSAAIGVGWYGSGIDGTADLDGTNTVAWASKSGSVYTMTRDAMLVDLTVRAGSTLKPSGYKIMCSGTLTNAGTIQRDGNNASGLTGGGALANGTTRGGTAGGNSPSSGNGQNGGGDTNAIQTGGDGGSGGASGGGASGGNGTGATATVIGTWAQAVPLAMGAAVNSATGGAMVSFGGGTGGGAGGVTSPGSSGTGGGGGGAGGCMIIIAQFIVNSGTISANGGNGANGVLTGGTTGAGGGGGGGGGAVILHYRSLTNSGTISANAGTKGTGAGTAGAATDGDAGRVIQIVI